MRITAKGIKSFVVEKHIDGKLRRQTLGRYGEITTEQARDMAQHYLGQIAFGVDPIAQKKTALALRITLSQAFADFVKARKADVQRSSRRLLGIRIIYRAAL